MHLFFRHFYSLKCRNRVSSNLNFRLRFKNPPDFWKRILHSWFVNTIDSSNLSLPVCFRVSVWTVSFQDVNSSLQTWEHHSWTLLCGLVSFSTFSWPCGTYCTPSPVCVCVCVCGWTDGHASYCVTVGGTEQPDQLVTAQLPTLPPPHPPLKSPFSSSLLFCPLSHHSSSFQLHGNIRGSLLD